MKATWYKRPLKGDSYKAPFYQKYTRGGFKNPRYIQFMERMQLIAVALLLIIILATIYWVINANIFTP